MDKKVGIVSCYFKNNYGSMLQAYATQRILDNNNIDNETISIECNEDFKNGKRKYYLSQIINFGFIKTKSGMVKLKVRKKLNKQLGKNISVRDKAYKEFRKEFNLTKQYRTYKELSEVTKRKYSDILLGSDQLWLPVNVVADYYTLNWVRDDVNKISYSTSFGVSSIPKKYNEQYKEFLSRINCLSVREDSGRKLIKKVAGLDAKLVCDPTLLLTKSEWKEVAVKEPIVKEKYILCYFLGTNIEHRKFAERLKKETGYKIVSLNHADEYVKYSDEFADFTPYNIGPKEWINLIENAEYVCTDSFHGTVFSLIFNKIFFDFRRYDSKNKNNTNSRIDSLLDIAGVSKERILTGKEDVNEVLKYHISFDIVNKNLQQYRNESKSWLLNSLKYKKKENSYKYIKIEDKSNCSGCSACYALCPKDAIKMASDEEGFLYPQVDSEKCVSCGLCTKVCPVLNGQKMNDYKQKAFLFQNKNEKVRADSTSGGFYSSIGEYVIKNQGIVYGAAYNDEFVVEHQKAVTFDELKKFRKSKYVQSNQNDIFREIISYLNDGRLVCYSGTPCQVAGLKAFLQKEYDNLITVDIMCHSVPSPLVFEKYKEYILKKMHASKIEDINFRDKSKYGYKYSLMTVKTDNGIYSEGIDTDPYLRAFFGDMSVRPSCYSCAFKTQKRVSDVTIWDCFNINEINKSFDDDKGTTRIIVQSQKGNDIIKKVDNVYMKEISLDIAIKNVKEMKYSVNNNEYRIKFLEDIRSNYIAFDKYFPKNLKTELNSSVRKILAVTGIYSNVKTLAKKILRK